MYWRTITNYEAECDVIGEPEMGTCLQKFSVAKFDRKTIPILETKVVYIGLNL